MRELIGLTIVAIKGYTYKYDYLNKKINNKYIEPIYILFNDNETFIQLDEQDYYNYHDCSSSARHIIVYKNKQTWNMIMNNEDYKDSNTDI